MNAFAHLHEALSALRAQTGLPSKVVAKRAGLHASLVSGYMTGRSVPSLLSLGKLLDAMGKTVSDLGAELESPPAEKVETVAADETPPSTEAELDRLGAEFGTGLLRVLRDAGVVSLGPSPHLQKNVVAAIDRVLGPPAAEEGDAQKKGKR
jgi:transcriptional regulator with XRE-family HTH domain